MTESKTLEDYAKAAVGELRRQLANSKSDKRKAKLQARIDRWRAWEADSAALAQRILQTQTTEKKDEIDDGNQHQQPDSSGSDNQECR